MNSSNAEQISNELVVVGAGPGGYAAAFLAADLGMQVSLIDLEINPGGVCLYRGCIPSKAYLHLVKVIDDTKMASKYGIEFTAPTININRLRAFKEEVVKKLTFGLGSISKQRKVNYISGRATFTSSNSLQIKKSDNSIQNISFKKAIIAVGSIPRELPGLKIKSPLIMDSTTALELPDIPSSLLVVGGGYIGLELGSMYASLGSSVTVVEMASGLLPGADRDIVSILERVLSKKFKRIMLNTRVTEIKEFTDSVGDTKLEVTLIDNNNQSNILKFDKILVAIGRKVDIEGLGLSTTKVSKNELGYITVDQSLKTTDDNIYAIGDVVGGIMLAHKATAEGKVAVEAILGHKSIFNPLAIPAVVFTDPEIAWTGLTENEAKAKGINYEVAKFPWGASGKATAIDRNDGMTKLLIDPQSERILGVAIVGQGAGDMISEGTLAIEMGAVVKDLALTIHPHPTLSETIYNAAESFYGLSTDIYKPKRK